MCGVGGHPLQLDITWVWVPQMIWQRNTTSTGGGKLRAHQSARKKSVDLVSPQSAPNALVHKEHRISGHIVSNGGHGGVLAHNAVETFQYLAQFPTPAAGLADGDAVDALASRVESDIGREPDNVILCEGNGTFIAVRVDNLIG